MDVSPKALREVQFREVRKNGYHPEDVDQFIEEVAKGVEGIQDRLRQAVERAQRAEAAASEAGGSDETLRRTLVLAQRTADLAVQEAREQAARILAGAEQQAQATVAEGEQRSRRAHEEALGSIRSELGALESLRQKRQGEVDAMGRWIEQHRHQLVDNLTEALRAVERAGDIDPPPAASPVEPRQTASGRDAADVVAGAPTGGAPPAATPAVPGPGAGAPATAGPGQVQPGPRSGSSGPTAASPTGPGPNGTVQGSVAPGALPPPGGGGAGMPSTGTATVAAPQAAVAAGTATAVTGRVRPGAPPSWRPGHDDSAPTGEVAVIADGPEAVIGLDDPDPDHDLDAADARALDEFFDDNDYVDDRRFGGRLRRRR